MSVRPTKTQISLGIRGSPGWSESSQGAHAIMLVLSWGGSFSFLRPSHIQITKAQPYGQESLRQTGGRGRRTSWKQGSKWSACSTAQTREQVRPAWALERLEWLLIENGELKLVDFEQNPKWNQKRKQSSQQVWAGRRFFQNHSTFCKISLVRGIRRYDLRIIRIFLCPGERRLHGVKTTSRLHSGFIQCH